MAAAGIVGDPDEDANPRHIYEQTVGYVMMSPRYQSDRLIKVGHSPELPIQKTLR
jgi:hypothetical protein